MRLLYTVVFLFITNIIFSQENHVAYISGTIKNISNQVEVEDMSDLGKLSLPKIQNIFIPDSAGQFQITLKLDRPGYYRIGRNILYVSLGDSIFSKLDFLNPELAIFHGTHMASNNYLKQTPFPMAGSYIANASLIGESVQSTIQKIIDFGKSREKKLLSIKNTPDHFVFLEKGRIRADIINSIIDIYYEFPYHHKLKADTLNKFKSNFKDSINEYLRPFAKGFIDKRYLQLTVYQKIADRLLELNNGLANTKSFKQINDWLKAESYFGKMNSSQNITQSDSLNIKINQIKTPQYRKKLQLVYEKLANFGNGSKAINFQAVNYGGATVSLDDYKGKVIFIDLWATWCGPCIQAFPVFEEIKDIFKSDTNIVFLSISIDENREKWKKFIDNKALSQPQWVIDRLDMSDYNIVGIPRTIIVDKTFSIYAFNGPSPQKKEEIIKMLSELSKL